MKRVTKGPFMLFWIIAFLLSVAVAASLLQPLLRDQGARTRDTLAVDTKAFGHQDIAIYRAQLAEVERDLVRGVLDPAEAERTRTEIARRLIAADKAQGPGPQNAPRGPSRAAGIVAALIVVAGSLALYARIGAPGASDLPRNLRLAEGEAARANRMSQAEAIAALGVAATTNRAEPPPEIQASVDNLRASLAENPDDLQGWQILAAFETRTGNLPAAADAMTQVVRIKGDAVTVDDMVGLVDLMVYAAQGYVSPEAEAMLDRIATVDPDNLAVRYYIGLLYDHTDRPDLAFDLWRTVIAEGGDSLHADLARLAIGDAAWLAGRDYTPQPETAPTPGPTAEQVAAAQDMTPEDRTAMIQGMVAQLSDRLTTEGGPSEDWAQLIASYGVLGDTEAARSVWIEAQTVFAESPTALDLLRDAALSAGLTE